MTSPIITTKDLRDALETHDDVVILDAGRGRAAWEAGHLANARYVNTNEQLSDLTGANTDASRGGRHPLPSIDVWCRTLGNLGVTPSTRVVVYDDQAGANAASRAWWMLRGVGHERVSLLDGGLAAAIAAGLPITREPSTFAVAPPYPCERWLLPTVDIDEVDALRGNPDWRIIDVRSATRFAGIEEPIDPIAGHIPGAINVPYEENLRERCFKTAEELRRLYDGRLDGVAPDHVVVHCGSGVTACHTLLALELAGMRGASLYVGSWSEWCRNQRPRASSSHKDGA